MTTVFITATEESTGKTAVALALALTAKDRGRSVGYMKPKGTRLESRVGKTLDTDPMLARDLLELDAETHDLEPVVYSPSFIQGVIRGQEDSQALLDRIDEAFETLAADRDLMILEGGGRPETGAVVGLTDADLAEFLDANVVLLASYDDVRDVDTVLATAEAHGDRLAGIVFNPVVEGTRETLETEVVPFLQSRGIPVLGVLPRVRELAGVSVAELVNELGGELLTAGTPADHTQTYVERFLVGAMGADAALSYFRRSRNAALVTGGDRADLQRVALETSGISCLVLTGGLRPPGTVLGTAEEQDVPVIMVTSDTRTTVDRVEALISGGRTRDERTVNRMMELLSDNADVDALLGE